MKTWLDPQPIEIPAALAAQIGGHPLLAATLARRGFTDPKAAWAFLDPNAYKPASPFDLPDMEVVVERVQRAIDQGELIAVWGDFDVDGQTATSLLVSALRSLGAQVTHYIPHRIREGHGIHIPKLTELIDSGAGLIITCDTGITAHDAVDYAQGRGVDVVITDHHLLPPELPSAYAVVNSQRLPPGHPLRTLPGVGCAFKLIEALYSRPHPPVPLLQRRGGEDGTPTGVNTLDSYLDLVALGIVADVAEQIGDTRYLLQRGLDVLRQTDRLGLKTMIEAAGLDPLTINEGDLGFVLGPQLNALGRLDDANPAVELLTTDDLETARILAKRVEQLNHERRSMSNQVFQAAVAQIERDPSLLDYAVLVLSHEGWPGGIVGIVASRLVERYSRPVILLSTDDGLARGSARSVSGVDITAMLAQQAALLTTFGGHTMAAGLSLPTERVPELRRALSRAVRPVLGQVAAEPIIQIDGWLPLGDLTPDLVNTLNRLAPFGPGNPPLVLASEKLTLKSIRPLGRYGEHQRLIVEDEAGDVMTVLWWQAEPESLPKGRFDLAYSLRVRDYQGKREVVLEYLDSRAIKEEPLTFQARAAVEVVDYRALDESAALETLATLGDDVMIWAEGAPISGRQTAMRHQLQRAQTLVVWTTPPGSAEMRAALEAVNPARVILFAHDSGTDAVQAFLQRFAGAVKFALNSRNGQVTLDALAAAVGHRPATARVGLAWMAARGHLLYQENEGVIVLEEGEGARAGTATPAELTASTTRLAELLRETASYRAYFKTADAQALVER
ncbi:MAG: single-stranded-DNA-specific exonuclease RecJ [bacterium]|nr:single-stranded-DNA-specific exonuclease RecJ [bacterium]